MEFSGDVFSGGRKRVFFFFAPSQLHLPSLPPPQLSNASPQCPLPNSRNNISLGFCFWRKKIWCFSCSNICWLLTNRYLFHFIAFYGQNSNKRNWILLVAMNSIGIFLTIVSIIITLFIEGGLRAFHSSFTYITLLDPYIWHGENRDYNPFSRQGKTKQGRRL